MKFNIYKTSDYRERSKEAPYKNAVAIQDDDYIESILRGRKWEIEITTLEQLIDILNSFQSKYCVGIILTTEGEPHEFSIEIYDGYRE